MLRPVIFTLAVLMCYQLHAQVNGTRLHCEGKLTRADNIDFGTTDAVFEFDYDMTHPATNGFLRSVIGVPVTLHMLTLQVDSSSLIGQEEVEASRSEATQRISSFTVSRSSGRFQLAWVMQKPGDASSFADGIWSGTCVKADLARNKF